VNGKRDVTGDIEDIKKAVIIINDDTREVAKISKVNGAQVANKNSVEMGETKESSGVIISHENQVAKETNYGNKEASGSGVKKLEIDYEATGIEVGKTGLAKAASATKVNTSSKVTEDSVEVSETSYPSAQKTDVGSSTQFSSMVQVKKQVKKASVKKAPIKKGAPQVKKVTQREVAAGVVSAIKEVAVPNKGPIVLKGKVVESGGQEAVIIRKVSRDENTNVKTKDGMISKMSIGRSDGGEDGVTFSSGGDGIESTGVTITPEDDGISSEFFSDGANVIDGDDLDLNILLSNE
jgi:hypothetical protein